MRKENEIKINRTQRVCRTGGAVSGVTSAVGRRDDGISLLRRTDSSCPRARAGRVWNNFSPPWHPHTAPPVHAWVATTDSSSCRCRLRRWRGGGVRAPLRWWVPRGGVVTARPDRQFVYRGRSAVSSVTARSSCIASVVVPSLIAASAWPAADNRLRRDR